MKIEVFVLSVVAEALLWRLVIGYNHLN